MTTGTRVLMTGISFGESPRWHDGRLWFCDWGAQEIIAVDPDGSERGRRATARGVCRSASTGCRTAACSSSGGRAGRSCGASPTARSSSHADLSGAVRARLERDRRRRPRQRLREQHRLRLDGRRSSRPASSRWSRRTAGRQVADGIAFPNGMAITPDSSTLIVAESYAAGSRRSTSTPTAACRTGASGPTSASGGAGRHLPRRRGRGLVRRRPATSRCLRVARGRRGARHDRPRPRLLRLHARRPGRADAVHGRARVGRGWRASGATSRRVRS